MGEICILGIGQGQLAFRENERDQPGRLVGAGNLGVNGVTDR